MKIGLSAKTFLILLHSTIPCRIYRIPSALRSQTTLGPDSTREGDHLGTLWCWMLSFLKFFCLSGGVPNIGEVERYEEGLRFHALVIYEKFYFSNPFRWWFFFQVCVNYSISLISKMILHTVTTSEINQQRFLSSRVSYLVPLLLPKDRSVKCNKSLEQELNLSRSWHKSTLVLTILRSLFKSYAKDLSTQIFELVFQHHINQLLC